MNDSAIRPTITSLRRLPTLQEVEEATSKLELKLQTDDTRYWLTTQGVHHKTTGIPINYVVDYVTVEKLSDGGKWNLRAVYSPEAWKLSQGFDYSQMLHRELDDLHDRIESDFSWETLNEIHQLEKELDQVNRVLSELADIVRSK